jgi:hypothetical protein
VDEGGKVKKLFERNDLKKNTGTGDVAAKQRDAYILLNAHRHNKTASFRFFLNWIIESKPSVSEIQRHAERILKELNCEAVSGYEKASKEI